MEVLLGSPRVKDLIHKGEVGALKEAMEKGAGTGMQTFDMHLYDLYKEGKITLDEALKNADSANNLRLRIKLDDDESFDESNTAFARDPKKKKGVGLQLDKQQ